MSTGVPAKETVTANNREKRCFRWLGKRCSLVRSLPSLVLSIALFFIVTGTTFLCHAAGEPNEIRVGVSLDFRPYDFVDKDGRPAGFTVALIQAIAEKMGLRVHLVTGSWDEVWNGLVAGKLDVLPTVTRTPSREALADFTVPHTETFDAFFVREGQPPIKDLAAAAGKEIVVSHSDAAHHQLVERKFAGKLILVETFPEGLRLIAAGRHDAMLCSKLVGVLEAEQAGIKGVKAGPPIPDYKRVFSFAVRKGNTDLVEKLNQGLAIVKADGTYDRLYRKWLGAEIGPPQWQTYFWQGIGIFGVLVLIAVTWVVARKAIESDRQTQALATQPHGALSAFWRYALAIVAVAAGYALRVGLEAWVGPGLPTFVTFYPAVMVAALLGGIGPGLLATVVTALITDIWIMPPIGQLAIASPVDRLAMALFCAMGLFMTAVARLYRRSRAKAAAFDREEALRETRLEKEFLASLLEAAEQPFAVGYPDGRIGLTNRAYEQLTGYTAAELATLDWSCVLTPPEWRDHERQKLEELHRTGRPVRYEKEYLRKDGTRVPIELLVDLRRDAAGQPEFYYSFITDVTTRKQAESALRESEQRWATTLSSIGDAVIATDKTGWITFMNTVAERLTGWTLAEATREPVTEVFNIINEQTRKIVENPVAKVLREGMIVGLANHTVLVRKDGTEAPIDDSGAPIRDGSGDIMGVVLVFRDITGRRRDEAMLRESKARLDLALQAAEMGAWHWDIGEDKRHFDDQVCRLLGIDPTTFAGNAKEFFDAVHPDDRDRLHRALSRTIEQDLPYEPEYRAVWPDGTIRHIAARGRLVRDDAGRPKRINGIIWDITERKYAEDEVRESRAKLEAALASMSDAVFISDAEGRFVEFNDAFAIYHRFKNKEECYQTLAEYPDYIDVYFPDGTLAPLDMWVVARALRGETITDAEYMLRRKDTGETWWGSYNFGPIRSKDGKIVGSVVAGREITDRKLQEARIARLTELYSMLSRVNEAIVRTRDREQLYREVCAIIAKEGSFPLVWIGEVAGRELAPVASCGSAADYLADIKVEIDGVLGQGPSGTCIREDRPVVNDDFDTNPATLPWREPALRHGFRASACFPLHRQGEAIGALTLYSTRPHDFDAEQVNLLQALTADVSYALDAIEHEKLRTLAEMDLQKSLKRFELLSHTAEELLQSPDPHGLVNSLCRKVMERLGCHAFFNFLAVEEEGKLRLNAYAGIPEEEAQKIQWLDYGVAVCGCAARDACRIVAEHIPSTPDPRTELVSSYGIKAYACHPLHGPDNRVMGTLSFGTRDRETFSDEDLSLMKAVADQVAVAMIRMRDEEAVRKARDELEARVQERTAELQQAYDSLMRETEERQKVEGQLRQAQKLEALGTLAGGIAHDFNNILAAIIGFTELIRDHTPPEGREHRHAQRVLDASVRGRELVRQMLTFSRQTEQEKRPLRLSSIVKESVKLLRASIPSTVSIRVSVKSESGVILGDPTQISQVLMNLATNAAHAMREKGGTLDIDLSDFSVSPSNGNPHGIEPGSYMKLTVRDTGTGIPPEIVDRIFDPFFTTKKVGEGTGLGLSVVLGIVKQARGYITVESEPPLGSTFDAYFPKIASEPAAERMAGDETTPIGNERILFVDDEEALIEMGEELLAELGYEVTCCTSSREALALFRLDPSRFDLVVTDLTMPDMTGIQLAAELLAIRPDIPVILCTGFSHTANEESARAAGIKGFAMKPLTKRELAKTVRKVLDG